MNDAASTASAPTSTIAYGAKYDRALSRKDIAARIRADIKAAVVAGELPAAKYSVRSGYSTYTKSIDVVISGVPGGVMNPLRMRAEVETPYAYIEGDAQWLHHPEARALLAHVNAIVEAYNFDGSDIQTDYFHVNFHVGFSHGDERIERDAFRAHHEMARERAAAKAEPAQVGYLAALGVL